MSHFFLIGDMLLQWVALHTLQMLSWGFVCNNLGTHLLLHKFRLVKKPIISFQVEIKKSTMRFWHFSFTTTAVMQVQERFTLQFHFNHCSACGRHFAKSLGPLNFWKNFILQDMKSVPFLYILGAFVPATMIAVLYYFDHNVSAQLAQQKEFNLRKPSAFHYDLLLLGMMVSVCGLLGIPPSHGVIPQSPMHTKSLATLKKEVLWTFHDTSYLLAKSELYFSTLPGINCIPVKPHDLWSLEWEGHCKVLLYWQLIIVCSTVGPQQVGEEKFGGFEA
jgi:hypothetical protein